MLSKQKAKYIQTLSQKKFRRQEKLFIAEGEKILNEILTTYPKLVREIFATKEWLSSNKKLPEEVVVNEISEDELKKISLLAAPQNVLAVVKQIDEEKKIVTENKITLALNGIQDPGNFGTIIRIADWFGVEQIVCSAACAELYNPKTIQATMGSFLRVKIFYEDLSQWLSSLQNIRIYATVLEGKDVSLMEKIKQGVIVIGNEANGISDEVLKHCNVKITIAKKGGAESLNAAVATGIILSHIC